MKNFFGVIVSVFVVASLCACTDYAQKIEDEYGPVKEESKKGDSFFNNDVQYKEFKDKRDKRTYKAVQIDGRESQVRNV